MAKVPSINCMPSIFAGINHCFQEILWQGMLFIYFPKKLMRTHAMSIDQSKGFSNFLLHDLFISRWGLATVIWTLKIVPIQNKKTHNLIAYSITVSNSTTSLILWNCHDSSNWTIFSFFMTHHFIFKIKWRPVWIVLLLFFYSSKRQKET